MGPLTTTRPCSCPHDPSYHCRWCGECHHRGCRYGERPFQHEGWDPEVSRVLAGAGR